MNKKKKTSMGKNVWYGVSWIVMIGVLLGFAGILSEAIVLPDVPFTVAGSLTVIGILVVFIITMGIIVTGLVESLEVKKSCTVCNGSGYVPAVGAWASEYDSDPCSHCGGSGEEPKGPDTDHHSSGYFPLGGGW